VHAIPKRKCKEEIQHFKLIYCGLRSCITLACFSTFLTKLLLFLLLFKIPNFFSVFVNFVESNYYDYDYD